MAKLKHLELPDGTNYDIYGVNVQEISYDDYETLTPTQKNSDIAYCITDTPYEVDDSIYGEANGTIASFNNGSANPLKSLEVDINPIQDLHGYDAPWAGGAGKNKVDVASGSTTTTSTLMQKELNAGTYTYSAYGKRNDGEHWRVAIASQGDELIAAGNNTSGTTLARSQVTFTLTETTTIRLKLQFLSSYDTLNYERVQLESGSTATDYAPYANICPISGRSSVEVTVADDTTDPTTEETYEISLGQTIYGGKLNVTTGELTVDRAMVEYDGSSDETWAYVSSYGGFRVTIADANINGIPSAQVISNRFVGSNSRGATDKDIPGKMLAYTSTSDNIFLFFTTQITDLSEWKTWLSENITQVEYPLATPTTISLTPTQVSSLLGSNNIWADSGDVDVVYITSDFIYNELRMNDTVIASNGFAYHSIESESATMAGHANTATMASHANTATTSTKLASDAGSNLNPVYFDDGIPVASIGNSVPFITGTGTVAGTWLGSLEGLTAYYDGLLILYKPSIAGAATTTLNINGLGAKTCYINSTTKLTTHYPANQPILLVYSANTNSGCFVAVDNYLDGNTIPNSLYYWNNTYAKTKLLANTVIVGDSSGYSTAAAGVQFDISYPILWTAAEVAQGSSNYASMFIQCYDRTLDTIKSGFTSTAKKIIYLVVTINGNIATVDSSIITDTLPSTDNGKVYISLGRLGAQSTGANYFNFQVTHPMFWYKGGKIVPYGATDAQTVNGHTVASDVPNNATFTDTTYTFANGTNGFTVTPSGGTAQTVTVTPSITNNVTGSGTSGYLAKFNGANTITNGAQLGSDTTKFLRNDGEWAVPPGAGGGVTGVKGDAESTYRTGNVNLTPANLGLESKSAASGGTDLSLVTTGEKAVWDEKPSTDTKNTAGSTDTSSKIYLVGATSQAANPQTYSQDTAYVGTDGCLYSGGTKVEVVSNNAGYHNSIYRGKSLGTSITTAQWNAISAGTFDDMYIGDYWTLSTAIGSTTSNIQYVIAGFDYWWNCGDSYPQSSNKHHVVLVPATNLYSAQMNATSITTGGYIGSAMYTTNLANARTGISTLFGNHLYSVRRLFTNSVNTVGQATGWAWATSSVDLMSETMVYGHPVWTTSGFEVGVDRTILPLFALNPASASIYSSWWLRSVATPSNFAYVSVYGNAASYNASTTHGVRPAFAIY